MAYNRQYKTRQSGRFNTPGQFVPATDMQQFEQNQSYGQEQSFGQQQQQYPAPPPPQQYSQQQRSKPAPPAPPPNQNLQQIKNVEPELKVEPDADVSMAEQDGDAPARPAWMKNKLPGVKKISKKERRRRQNAHLRRLIAPKNALMVLNEMMLNDQMANQFTVEPAANAGYYKSQNKHSFCADLTLDGQTYKGFGENKLAARNAAAEQAIRDLIIKRLGKVCNSEAATDGGSEGGESEESLPMIQIASFALHKLFSEWEYEGHKVPQIKPLSVSQQSSDAEMEVLSSTPSTGAPRPPAAPKKPKEVPANARAMHPSMLLSYMRPHVEYRELQVDGDKPQNMVFTVGVEVDGSTYVGKASNKKEARKAAARAACCALFNVSFDEVPTANAPLAPTN